MKTRFLTAFVAILAVGVSSCNPDIYYACGPFPPVYRTYQDRDHGGMDVDHGGKRQAYDPSWYIMETESGRRYAMHR